MVQGLFDDTEDKSESDKKRTSIFSDDVLFKITESNYQRANAKKPIAPDVAEGAEAVAAAVIPSDEIETQESASLSNDSEFAEMAETLMSSDKTEVEKVKFPSPDEMRFEKVKHTSPDMTEINQAATLMSPSDKPKIEETMTTLPDEADIDNAVYSLSDETKIEKAVPPTDETDETRRINIEEEPLTDNINVREKPFVEPEINISFSDPHDLFSTAEPIIETDKKDAPPLFQTQYTPELPEDTARKSGLALSAGIALFVAVVFMMIVGWFADLLLGTSPWGLVCGIVVGSVIGFYQFFRTTSQIMK